MRVKPAAVIISPSCSDFSIEVVPTSIGCMVALAVSISLTMAFSFSAGERYTSSCSSVRDTGRLVGISTTSSL